MGKYFTARAAQMEAPAPSVRNFDDSYCIMLADEMKKIQSAVIKRDLKRNLLDAGYAAQAQDEQLALSLNTNILLLQSTGEAAQITMPTTADAAQQMQSSGDTAEGAQVLLQFVQQQP